MLSRTGPTLLLFITGCGPSPSCPLLWTLPPVTGQVGVLLDSETGRAALRIHAPTRLKVSPSWAVCLFRVGISCLL